MRRLRTTIGLSLTQVRLAPFLSLEIASGIRVISFCRNGYRLDHFQTLWAEIHRLASQTFRAGEPKRPQSQRPCLAISLQSCAQKNIRPSHGRRCLMTGAVRFAREANGRLSRSGLEGSLASTTRVARAKEHGPLRQDFAITASLSSQHLKGK